MSLQHAVEAPWQLPFEDNFPPCAKRPVRGQVHKQLRGQLCGHFDSATGIPDCDKRPLQSMSAPYSGRSSRSALCSKTGAPECSPAPARAHGPERELRAAPISSWAYHPQ